MTRSRKLLSAAGVALLAAAAWFIFWQARPAQADYTTSQSVASDEVEKDWGKLHYESASACAECHTNPKQRQVDAGNLKLVMLTEYSIWQIYDKHAQAYAVLKGPRGKQMGDLLKSSVLEAKTGCLNCHAMNNLIEHNKTAGAGPMVNLTLEDGVSCGGCHGPSTAKELKDSWHGDHAQIGWRENNAQAKYKLGMRDLRDPVIRAELCMSCHVGNAAEGKVVTHAMMAAGHPPLPPIEVVTFAKNEPQHWRNAAAVPFLQEKFQQEEKEPDEKKRKYTNNYHLKDLGFLQTQFALIGNVVAIRETFRLASDRADFKATKPAKGTLWPELNLNPDYGTEPKGRWPEIALAHSDCFACHHDLRFPGFRQARGFGYLVPGLDAQRVAPGRPVIRSWPLAGLAAASVQTDKKLDGLKTHLEALAKATNLRAFGDDEQIKKSAGDMVGYCNDVIADLRKSAFNRDKALALAKALCTMWDKKDAHGNEATPDYETARQMASLLRVVVDELKLDKATQEKLAEMNKTLGTEPFTKRNERVEVTLGVVSNALNEQRVAKMQPKKDYTEGMKLFKEYLTDITDPKLLDKQVGDGNDFLVSLANGLSSKLFTQELLKEDVVKKLQDLSDAEQKELLAKISAYDPVTFKAKLHELLPLIK